MRVQREMEIELSRREREKEQLSVYMQQMEKDHKVALKNEQEQHHEDVDRLVREKVTTLMPQINHLTFKKV